jgi:hypothetical protein
MSATTFQQMADRVADLMEERLRIRGRGLPEKLRRGGRALPRSVRASAEALALAAAQGQNPKLLIQIDPAAVAAHYDVCLKHLQGLNRWERRMAILGSMASAIVMSLLAAALLVLVVLYWRGFL